MMPKSPLMAEVSIQSADVDRILNRLSLNGVVLTSIERVDYINARFTVKTHQYSETISLLKAWGVDFETTNKYSDTPWGSPFHGRFVLKLSIFILLAMSIYLQGKVLFIFIDGNSKTSTRQILEVVSNSGIHFGTNAKILRSENVKNQLLAAIPELQWVGVEIKGSVATIHVQEREDMRFETNRDANVVSIISCGSGVITSCSVTRGTAMCEPGQTVAKEQVLISGYTDCGSVIKGTHAKGEVYAQTERNIIALAPASTSTRSAPKQGITKYSIRIGKKLINFNNNSGIYSASCVKMYTEYNLVLAGGFELPITVIKETVQDFEMENCKSNLNNKSFVEYYCDMHIIAQMISGQIVSKEISANNFEGIVVFNGRYICTEMIGREKIEQIIQGD